MVACTALVSVKEVLAEGLGNPSFTLPARGGFYISFLGRWRHLESSSAAIDKPGRSRRLRVGQSGHAALIDVDIRGDADDSTDKIDPILAAIEGVQTANPDVFVGEFGDASADKALNGVFQDDLKKAALKGQLSRRRKRPPDERY